MSLDDDYVSKLSTWLNAQNTTDPPGSGVITLIRPGLLQESPVAQQGILLLHIGDPDKETYLSEMIKDQSRSGGASKHQLLGGYREIGGGGLYWHRYSATFRYFMVRSGESRDEARGKADTCFQWARSKIARGQPLTIGLSPSGDEAPMEVAVVDWTPIEGGGPDHLIWDGYIKFQMLVGHEA